MLFVPFGDGWFRAIAWDRSREEVPLSEPVTGDEIRRSFRRIAGDDFGMEEPRWSTRFLSERRQARSYRKGACSSRATPPTCTPRSGARA